MTGFDEYARERQLADAANNRAAILARLSRRAADTDRAAAQLETQIARRRTGGATVNLAVGGAPDRIITDALRNDLVALGAVQPDVAVQVVPIGSGLQRAIVTAQWNEPLSIPSSVINGLAARRTYLRVNTLSLRREDALARTHTEASLQFEFHVEGNAGR